MPLGLVEGVEYEETTLTLGPGDSLVMFTDGLAEALEPGGRRHLP